MMQDNGELGGDRPVITLVPLFQFPCTITVRSDLLLQINTHLALF